VRQSFIGRRDRSIGGFICLRSGCGVHWRFPFPSNVIPGSTRPFAGSTSRQHGVQSHAKNGRMMERMPG
jgi:hypothetical protein